MFKYDSTNDTFAHIRRVQQLLGGAAAELMHRADKHDLSKLRSPEKELFDEYTPKLKDSTYGSPEYQEFLKGLKPALDHHYANNSHHPEFFGEKGVNGMNLYDLLEMFLDWKAATERHANGDIFKSIEINKERFSISQQLCDIFKNTAEKLVRDGKRAEEIYGQPGQPADHYPIYSWTKGWFSYRIERNYFSGGKEVIARIPVSLPDAEELAIKMTKNLINNR
jgi:Family of unknown function (DUF5662)